MRKTEHPNQIERESAQKQLFEIDAEALVIACLDMLANALT